ncbi:MAG: ADP-ribose pyrophosphatase [Thiotrichales bacterium]|nr:MAG: ADP-ribose pyrophosphatase [Thiotrichales bacterium]
MTTKYKYGVYIGRFQPFHLGHLHSVTTALQHCEKLLIIVGSIKQAPSLQNPFSLAQRKSLIEQCIQEYDATQQSNLADKIQYAGVQDYLYQENAWFADVKNIVHKFTGPSDKVAIVGHHKDSSSYYLEMFADWERLPIENHDGINSANIRKAVFANDLDSVTTVVPKATATFLQTWQNSKDFVNLQNEFVFTQKYRASWQHSPFPNLFVTVDSLVICKNHILLIQRKQPPGKNLWAMPGGFIEEKERIQTGILRELQEETNIDVPAKELIHSQKTMQVFDYPQRSSLGRIITHAGVFILQREKLPKIHAADDAKSAKWVSITDFYSMSEKMHGDHYQIICKLLLTYVADKQPKP